MAEVPSQMAVAAHFTSEQLLPFDFANLGGCVMTDPLGTEANPDIT